MRSFALEAVPHLRVLAELPELLVVVRGQLVQSLVDVFQCEFEHNHQLALLVLESHFLQFGKLFHHIVPEIFPTFFINSIN